MTKNHVLVLCLVLFSTFSFSQKIYIAENGAQLIQRSNLDGTSLGPVSSAGQVNSIRDIVVDQSRNKAYWIENDATFAKVLRADIVSVGATVQLGTPEDFISVPTTAPNQFEALVIDEIARDLWVSNFITGSIFKVSLSTSSTITVLPAPIIAGEFRVYGLDLDLVNNKIYYINDATGRQIRMANLDGTGKLTIVANFTEVMKDIAVDPAGGKIYYSADVGGDGQIATRDLAGTDPSLVPIITGLQSSVRGIALDLQNGQVFWADGFSKIGRADLDGSNSTEIVSTGLDAPLDVALDLNNTNPPKVYWSENVGAVSNDDEIHRIGIDGSDFEVPYSGFSDEISGLEIDEINNYMYWTDAAQAEIFRGLIGETSFSTNEKLIDFNPSSAAGLFDIALDIPNNTIYYTHGNAESGFTNKISKADISAPDPNTTVVEIIDTGLEEPFGIDLDLANGKIYYITNRVTTGTSRQLYRADLDGGNVEMVYSTGSPDIEHFRDVKIDPVNELVYWTSGEEDTPLGTIFYNDINEAAPFASPTSFTFGGEPWGLDLDLFNNKIYWVCRGASDGAVPPAIMQSDLDGSNIINLFNITVFPSGFPPAPPGSSFIALDLRGLASPLNLVSTTPGANSSGVAANSNIVFNFDQDVDGSTVNSSNILVTGDQTGPIQGSFTGAGTSTITFNPINDFKAGEFIQVSITNNVRSTSNVPLTKSNYQSFTVGTTPSPQNPPFFVQRPIFSNGLNVGIDRVVAIDVNQDGFMDLATIYDGTEGGIAWYQNDGSQQFTRQIALNSTFSVSRSVAAADLDLDGDIDLLSAQNGALYWYENDGAFGFTQIFINQVGIGHGIPDMRIADINGDGYLDIVTLFASGINNLHRIVFFENSGSQSFARTIFESTINVPQSLELVDMDKDGDVDIAAAGVSGEVGWYENDGNLNFTPHTFTNSLTSQYEGFAVGDFNGDGQMDMAATTTTQIVWMENDGLGNFSERVISLAQGNNDLHAADIDGDGDLDLIGGSQAFRFYENDGSGNFTTRTTSVSTTIEDIFPADVDSDGDIDVLVGGTVSVIAWLENTVSPNTPPFLSSTSSSVTYSGSPIVVDAAIDISDSDSPNLVSATIQITPATVVPNEDILMYTNQNGIIGSYNSTNGTLSLSGSALLANYRTALRSIQYQNTSNTPDPTSRVVEFLVNDGFTNSNIKSSTIAFVSGNQSPVFSPNTLTTVVKGSVSLTLSTIVSDPDGNLDPSSFNIVQQPISGAIASIANGVLIIDYSNTTFSGQDNLIIEVFDLNGARAEATIVIQVEGTIVLYNGLSPNGDSFNSYFRIENIEVLEPNNNVSIFNRWGDKVFEVDNYNNNDPAKRFNGESDKGKDLPSGVYFYKIEFASGSPELTGYLTIKR